MGAAGGVVLVGLWAGASSGAQWAEWRCRRFLAPALFRRLAVPGFAGRTGVVWGVVAVSAAASSLWAAAGGGSPWRAAVAHMVLLAIATLSVLAGWTWASLLRADRLGAAFGLLTWAPFLASFVWVPYAVPHSRQALEWALNASPIAGVASALGRQDILWAPLFYGRLPYAEYGAGLWSPAAHLGLWCGAALLLGALAFVWSVRHDS
jgi:hypothetical protein